MEVELEQTESASYQRIFLIGYDRVDGEWQLVHYKEIGCDDIQRRL